MISQKILDMRLLRSNRNPIDPLNVIIHSSGESDARMAAWRESDERSLLSLRIKHSESDLTPKGAMPHLSEYLPLNFH